ncbi:MAG: hypothetical protein LBU16_09340 [Treponema sp.]|nr:hypothetical protein [Treponema sp.]
MDGKPRYAAASFVSTEGRVVHSGAYQQNYYVDTGYWINAYWNFRALFNFSDSDFDWLDKNPRAEGDYSKQLLRAGGLHYNASFAPFPNPAGFRTFTP